MGIASDSVDNFAETVSKFSAITGISAETAAQSFGRLGQLLGINANEFENLSSAITYTGVNSVATDQEILSMSESIAAAGKQAGFSADQVIGMSAALASLKIRPEEARGVLARLFREIDLQVAQAGTGLGDFAQTLGTTSDKAAALWKQDPSGFFQKFLAGAQSTGKLNETLVALGITNTREMNVIQRLSQNTGMLSKTMADAEKQYMLGTYSSKAYGLVVDDLNSKFTIFQSTLAKMSASFGDAMSGGVKVAVDILTTLANAIGQLPTGIKWLVAILGILGATAAFVFGGLALGIAGLLAMKLALGNLAREGINASISFRTLGALMMSLAPTSGAAAAAMRLLGFSVKTTETGVKSLSVSMKSMLMSTGIGIAIAGLSMIFDAMANSANNANNSALAVGNAMLEAGGGADAFSQALAADQAAISKGAEAIGTLTLAYDEHNKSRVIAEQQGLAVGRASESINKAYAGEAAASGKLTDGVSALNDATAIYNDTISQTGELTKTVTANMGAKTAAFYVEALSKYKGANGDQATFWEAYLNPNNAQGRQIAEAMGFKFSSLISSGMKKAGGATEYIDSFKTKVQELDNQLNQLGTMAGPEARASLIQQYGKDAGWTAEQIQLIADKGSTLGGVSATLDSMYTAFGNAATGVDGLRTQLEQNQAVIEQNSQAMQQLGYSAEVADGLVGGLAETLKGYMDAAFSGAAANNAAADSFQTYATGISDVSDGLSGARQDAANWVSYMNAAREAAVQNGEGFAGSVKRILAGIEALAKAGKDTKKPFEDMKLYLENAAKGEGFGTLAVEIAKATDPKQLDGLIRAWMLTDAVTKDATGQAKAYGETLLTALSTDPALVKTLLASFSNISSSAGKAKTAIEKMSEALDKLFEKFNRKMNLEAAFDSLGASLAKNKKNFNAFTEDGRSNITALQEVISQLAISADGDKQKMANSLQSLKTAFMQMGVVGGTAMNLINIALKSTGKTGKNIASAIKNAVKSITGAFTDALTADTKDSVRLVGDYVNDLQSIISDAFDNRYGKQTGLDEIASAWESIRDSAKSAQQAIDDANRSIAELNVDKNLLEYQLKVAVKYGDTKRQIAIKNKLAEVNSKLADESAKISESVASRDKTLDVKNNSKAAIENRNQVRGMVKTYTDYLATLAKTGMSSGDLKKQAATMAAEFLTQGQNLGFAKEELSAYTSAFEGDFTKVIDALPQDYTLTVNTDPALRAIETFVQKANDALNKIVIPGSQVVDQQPKPSAEAIATYKNYKKVVADPKATYVSKADAMESIRFFEKVYGAGYKNGGLIKGAGTGTSDSIPARLSNGEYVVNANAVSKYGVDFMNSLNQMRASGTMPSSVGAGMGSGGSSMVYLSPEDRQLLRAAIDRPVALYTENTKIAASANAGNLLLAQRGSN
jgi:TP901 family phage tail tape measure protein